MILVTGVTGTVGREVASRLLGRGGPLRVLVRDPARLALPGPVPGAAVGSYEVAVGSYGDGGSLARALAGVTAAFLVTADPSAPHDAAFLRAARGAGVRHVVKLSAHAVGDPGADDLVTAWQRANEDALRASGLGWTLLRPRAFMTNTLGWARSVREEGVVRAPFPDSANACVDPRDVAEVAVRALTEPGHAGLVYPLTGPEAVTARQQTAALARAVGRPLDCRELPLDRALEGWRRRYPAGVAEALAAGALRQAAGGKAAVDPAFERLTGRAPRSYARWAEDHRAAFT
ncbi:NAD(P)H-binding protein [Streptomyces sp. NPDC050560]|uniref:NAD(P)H-binding protein n=1 Tax=Streptomyces sp. NPDC050560 TaxID=3365630 RepID=UPI0037B7F80F